MRVNRFPVLTAAVYGLGAGVLLMMLFIAGFWITDGGGPGASPLWSGLMTVGAVGIAVWLTLQRSTAERSAPSLVACWALAAAGVISASVAYVLTWESYLAATDFRFIHEYADTLAKAKVTRGFSEEQLRQELASVEALRQALLDPAYRQRETLGEFLPAATLSGALTSSAWRLRRRTLNATEASTESH